MTELSHFNYLIWMVKKLFELWTLKKLKRTTVKELFMKLITKIENTTQNPDNENYLVENKIKDLYDLKNQLDAKL